MKVDYLIKNKGKIAGVFCKKKKKKHFKEMKRNKTEAHNTTDLT